MNNKAAERIEKLLRLASPDSGTTEHERMAAALAAAELFAKGDIKIGDRPEPAPRAPAPGPVRVVREAWVLTVAIDHVSCSYCGNKISPRDHVYVRIRSGYAEHRHQQNPCRP